MSGLASAGLASAGLASVVPHRRWPRIVASTMLCAASDTAGEGERGDGTISVEDTVNASTTGSSGPIVIAGAGYAGLHVALRLAAKLRSRSEVELTLVD